MAQHNLFIEPREASQPTIEWTLKLDRVLSNIGGFGKVYKCIKLSNKQVRAVKLIKKGKTKKQSIELTSVISILKELDHPNIVKLYEFYEELDRYYLVMEYSSQQVLNWRGAI